MKKVIALLIVCYAITGVAVAQSAKTKKAVFVIVDGIAADVIQRMQPPTLTAIARQGAYTTLMIGGYKGTYSETPTISAVGYNSLLTGTWVHKHNVWGNAIKAPNYNYPTIFRLFKTAYPQKKTAIFSTWLDNRTKLLGEGLPGTEHFKTDYSYDGLELDTLTYPHDKLSYYIHKIDEAVVQQAATVIKQQAPDLSWVYLQYTDDIGHKFGDSPEYEKAVMLADAQMGKLYEAIQYRQKKYNEEWLLIITTDHGRDAATGKHHGGQSTREKAGWLVINTPLVNRYFHTGHPAIVDIMPSIADYLSVPIPRSQLMELDGVSLVKPVSISRAEAATVAGNQIKISWEALDTAGKVKVWISPTNYFKTSGVDNYQLAGEVPILNQQITLPLQPAKDTLYKIVLEAEKNTINCWWQRP